MQNLPSGLIGTNWDLLLSTRACGCILMTMMNCVFGGCTAGFELREAIFTLTRTFLFRMLVFSCFEPYQIKTRNYKANNPHTSQEDFPVLMVW